MTNDKTYNLNITERLICTTYLNQFKGSLEQTAFVLEDLRKLALTEDEKTKAEFVTDPETNQVKGWKNYEGSETDVALSDSSVKFVLKTFKEKTDFVLTDPLYPFYGPLLAKLDS